jgi:hypothetical protein
MKECGILMAPENYVKSENGTKTQTRRIIKLPLGRGDWKASQLGGPGTTDSNGRTLPEFPVIFNSITGKCLACPYGTVGDRLYVKEGLEISPGGHVQYRRDGQTLYRAERSPWSWQRNTLSPLHMPKWAARLWLEITEVRVERLQEISYDDEGAEGIALGPDCNDRHSGFIALWESIHGTGSWNFNPWVWVITYRNCATWEEAP